MEGQGSPSPKPPPKKKRVKSQAPKDKAKRRDRLLDDQDVQELLQEERAAYSLSIPEQCLMLTRHLKTLH